MDRIEVKFSTDDLDEKTGEFSGYGAVFGNVDSYGDVISPGAFKGTLRDWKREKKLPPMLVQHGGWMIQLGLNDFNSNVEPDVFAANMRTIVAAMKAVGDVALIVPTPPGIARTYPWQSYNDATHRIAADEGLRLVDLTARFGSYTAALAQGFVTDTLHLSYAGYGDAGYAIRELVKE